MSTVRDQIRVALEDEGLDGVMAVFTSWLSFQLAAEREACAQLIERRQWEASLPAEWGDEMTVGDVEALGVLIDQVWRDAKADHAAAIRARGAREARA